MKLVLPFAVLGLLTASIGEAAAATTYPSIIAINSDGSVWVEELDSRSQSCSPGLGPVHINVGSLANIAADVDGDGLTDLVSWSPNAIYVSYGQVGASGAALFGAPVEVYNQPFYGNKTNIVGDLNGDQLMDLIAWNADSVWVLFGQPGRTFSASTLFSSGLFYGDTANVLMDVDDDGKQDLVAWNKNSLYYEVSQGFWAGPSIQASQGPYYGDVANISAETPRSPGKKSALGQGWPIGILAWNTDSVYVNYVSLFQSSSPLTTRLVSHGPFFGSRANLNLDINLDGWNDLIAVNDSNVYVELFEDTATGYGKGQLWCNNGAFYGNVATLGGYTAR